MNTTQIRVEWVYLPTWNSLPENTSLLEAIYCLWTGKAAYSCVLDYDCHSDSLITTPWSLLSCLCPLDPSWSFRLVWLRISGFISVRLPGHNILLNLILCWLPIPIWDRKLQKCSPELVTRGLSTGIGMPTMDVWNGNTMKACQWEIAMKEKQAAIGEIALRIEDVVGE